MSNHATSPGERGPLASIPWWKTLVEGALRQNLQILLPFLALVGAGGQLDGRAVVATLVAFVVATVSVILLRVAHVAPPPDSDPVIQYGYRAVSAVAASLAATFTAEGFDLLQADARAIAVAALASGLTALIHGLADPPASVVRAES